MKYTKKNTKNGETLTVTITLDDDCNNGHQDFSITREAYEAGKPRTDKYLITAGCIHEKILNHFPEFEIFVNLHLCDYRGIPMHAVANGFFHINDKEGGMNKDEFCKYYRVTPQQYDILKTSEDETLFAYNLVKLGILDQWRKEANKGIKMLENLTGEKFQNTSKKTNMDVSLTNQDIAKIDADMEAGIYSPEKIRERNRKKQEEIKQRKIQHILDRQKKNIDKIKRDDDIKITLLKSGIDVDNIIYYHHNNTVQFNWQEHERQLTQQEIDKAKEVLKDKGVNFK